MKMGLIADMEHRNRDIMEEILYEIENEGSDDSRASTDKGHLPFTVWSVHSMKGGMEKVTTKMDVS